MTRIDAAFKAAGAAPMHRDFPAGMADPQLFAGKDDAHPLADQPPRHRIGIAVDFDGAIDPEEWSAFVRLAAAVVVGAETDTSFRDGSFEHAAILKAAGLPKDLEPPPDNSSVDLWARGRSLFAFLLDVTAAMNAKELERVRLMINLLPSFLATVEDVLPLAALPRHARRKTLAAHGVLVTQDTIAMVRDLWRLIEIRLLSVPSVAVFLRVGGKSAEGLIKLQSAALAAAAATK